MNGTVYLVGIGPGSQDYITPRAVSTLKNVPVIIAVILLIIIIARIKRFSEKDTSCEAGGDRANGKVKLKLRSYLQAMGTIFIILGIIILLVNLSLFKWVFWVNILSSAVIAIGVAAVLISRRR